MYEIKLFKLTDATHTLQPGEFLFHAGEKGECAYVLLQGEIEIIIDGIVVERCRAGALFGEMALIEHLPRSASARAFAESKLMAIDQRRFLFLVQQHPFFAQQVMGIMAERLRAMNQTLAQAGLSRSS